MKSGWERGRDGDLKTRQINPLLLFCCFFLPLSSNHPRGQARTIAAPCLVGQHFHEVGPHFTAGETETQPALPAATGEARVTPLSGGAVWPQSPLRPRCSTHTPTVPQLLQGGLGRASGGSATSVGGSQAVAPDTCRLPEPFTAAFLQPWRAQQHASQGDPGDRPCAQTREGGGSGM